MPQLAITTSPAAFPHGSADALLAELAKIQANFTELYTGVGQASDVTAETARAEAAEATLTAAVALRALKIIPTYAVAGVPTASTNTGVLIRVSDGAAGSPCLALSDGTNWKVVATLGATIAAS